MRTYFDIEGNRKIFDAVDVTYHEAIIHPTRENVKFHDIVYMMDGFFDFKLEDSIHKAYPGDVFVLPAGSSYEGVSLCGKDTRTVYIHAEALESDILNCIGEDETDRVHVPVGTLIHTGDDAAVRELFYEIALVKCSDKPQKYAMLNALFKSLLCLIYTCESKTLIKKSDIVNECIEIMRQNPRVFFKEAEMAEKLFVSDKTLRKAFEKRYNKSFYKFQLDYKLSQAVSVLASGSENKIYEISDSLGFNDEFHFSKLFKKKYGMPPSVYRKKFEK